MLSDLRGGLSHAQLNNWSMKAISTDANAPVASSALDATVSERNIPMFASSGKKDVLPSWPRRPDVVIRFEGK